MGTLQSQERSPALTSRQIEILILDLPDARLAAEVRTRGITRPFRVADLQRLRDAGAGPQTQAALSPFLVTSSLKISVSPAIQGAIVTVGPQTAITDSVGTAIVDGLVPGTHRIAIEKSPAVLRTEQVISLAEGGSHVYVPLRVFRGKLTVLTSVQNARIEIRDVGVFTPPLREYELPAGAYVVAVTAPAYLPFTAEVEVQGDRTKVFQPTLLPDRVEMVKFVAANGESLQSELRGLLERGDHQLFQAKANILLEYGGEKLFEFRLLHHHASAFHDAKLTLTRSGLFFEPLAPCLWRAELIPWARIARTTTVHQGSKGVLMLVEVAAGKKLNRRIPLNFSVFGSFIGQESETKPIKAGRVILGQSITTRNRVQSPPSAASVLSDLSWMIDQAVNANRLSAPQPPLLTPPPHIPSR